MSHVTNTFTAGTTAKSAEMNKNFQDTPVALNRQEDISNSVVGSQRICIGWGFIPGNATKKITETVTFHNAFDDVPIVIINPAGSLDNVDPAVLSDLTGNWDSCEAGVGSISTTGFTVRLSDWEDNMAAVTRYGYTWIAIGTKA